MQKPTKAKSKRGGARKGAGKKPLFGTKLIAASVHMTAQQRQKMLLLGGNTWLRAAIDAAPLPVLVETTEP